MTFLRLPSADPVVLALRGNNRCDMNIIRLEKDNMINGPGIRLVVWFRGCNHHCSECHNPETWGFEPSPQDLDASKNIDIILKELSKDYYAGVTLTGGCPFCQDRVELLEFVKIIKETLPEKNIWCWAGETYEELCGDLVTYKCLEYIDVLVDGPYKRELRKLDKYSGSTNQRVIDVQLSLQRGEVVLWENKYDR